MFIGKNEIINVHIKHFLFYFLFQIKEELSRNLNSTMMNNYNYDLIITKAIDDMQKEVE